jgi:hypothetical protein
MEELQGVAKGCEEGVLTRRCGEDSCEAGEGSVGAKEQEVEFSEPR